MKAIVVYDPQKRQKQLANLEKARAARGKLSTKIKKYNRAVVQIQKSFAVGVLRSVPGVCHLLKNAMPMIINGIAGKIPTWGKQKAAKRR